MSLSVEVDLQKVKDVLENPPSKDRRTHKDDDNNNDDDDDDDDEEADNKATCFNMNGGVSTNSEEQVENDDHYETDNTRQTVDLTGYKHTSVSVIRHGNNISLSFTQSKQEHCAIVADILWHNHDLCSIL